ncbi:conserved hypothetical protein [Ricinus communis]|uniref:Uncharacterized protein n=1 Tax=Ricinus communis TaxID=3988 RepID=B9SW61_RICCO|nr:conserved hypothetical protein [Ricinus communis]
MTPQEVQLHEALVPLTGNAVVRGQKDVLSLVKISDTVFYIILHWGMKRSPTRAPTRLTTSIPILMVFLTRILAVGRKRLPPTVNSMINTFRMQEEVAHKKDEGLPKRVAHAGRPHSGRPMLPHIRYINVRYLKKYFPTIWKMTKEKGS